MNRERTERVSKERLPLSLLESVIEFSRRMEAEKERAAQSAPQEIQG